MRQRALADPRGFLEAFPDGAVLDEVQRAPELLSYIQVDVDARRQRGRWILTGSQNLLLLSNVSQSLAGRSALLELLPFSVAELRAAGWLGDDLFAILFRGGYPALFDRDEEPAEWLASYVATYVERDVRQALNIGDLLAFQTFLGLSATRTAQLLNLSQRRPSSTCSTAALPATCSASGLPTSSVSTRCGARSSNPGWSRRS